MSRGEVPKTDHLVHAIHSAHAPCSTSATKKIAETSKKNCLRPLHQRTATVLYYSAQSKKPQVIMSVGEFRKQLFKLSNKLTDSDVKKLKFLCADIPGLPRRDLEKVSKSYFLSIHCRCGSLFCLQLCLDVVRTRLHCEGHVHIILCPCCER